MQDVFSLAGKAALVTGAGRGIGQSVAMKLAGAGADIAACDLQEEWLGETAAAVRKQGRRAECIAMNVALSASVAAGVEKASGLFGKIDILVNNAGITKDTLLMRMSDEAWNDVIAVNLTGTFLVSRSVSKIMIKQRSGTIINIASIVGLIGNAGQCNYAASKGGVIALTKSIARELASRNVRANAVAPGFIQTKMTEELSEEIRSKVLEAIPLKRWGQPEDVANAVLFLACDASSYLTGQVLSVGGGMVM